MRKSAKKQQSQVQRTVSIENVAHDNSDINNFWKGSRWFYRQCRRTFISYDQNQENGCLEDYICVWAFEHNHSQFTKCFPFVPCFACRSFGDSSQQHCPGKPCKERKTHRVFSNVHTFPLTRMQRCVLKSRCYKAVWSNYRPAGRMWPATAFSVTRGSIQKKSSNLKYVEKRVRLHLSQWIASAG